MRLNAFEKAMMNNPVRALVQRRVEAARLLRMGGRVPGGRVLELGCGRGVGVEILLDAFGAAHVDAFDVDPDMIALARRRLARRGDRVRLWVGDAERIDAPDAAYDAVFDFGIVHHVPDWRATLREVRRVLVPGGRFYCEEVMRAFIAHPLWRRLLDHPRRDRFAHDELGAALADAGLVVLAERTLGPWVGWYVAQRPRG